MGKKRATSTNHNSTSTGNNNNNSPIPLPHDGPIYYHAKIHSLSQTKGIPTGLDDNDENDTPIEESMEKGVLKYLIDPIVLGSLYMIEKCGMDDYRGDDDEHKSPLTTLSILLHTLITATQLHTQLQALQKFRNWKIQHRNNHPDNMHNNNNGGNVIDHNNNTTITTTTPTTSTTRTINEPTTFTSSSLLLLSEQYLYRILFEWMISYRSTSVPLRHAIHSCISVMLVQPVPNSYINNINNNNNHHHGDDQSLLRHTIWDQIFNSIVLPVLPPIVPPRNDRMHHEGTTCFWTNPLYTLNEFLSWESIEEWVQKTDTKKLEQMLDFVVLQTTRMGNTAHSALSSSSSSSHSTTTSLDIDQIVLAANITNKCLILIISMMNENKNTKNRNDSTINTVRQLQQYVWNIIMVDYSIIPMDRFSNIGIAYGRTIQYEMIYDSVTYSNDDGVIQNKSVTISGILDRMATLQSSALQRITIVQGIAVIVPLDGDKDMTLVDELVSACKIILVEECDPDVRCFALKGLRTLISRINTVLTNDRGLPHHDNDGRLVPQPQSNSSVLNTEIIRRIAGDVLQIVLLAWENPSTRKLANAIPALFECVIQVMMKLSIDQSLDELVDRILAQPPNLKGRYLALEIIMPITGVTRFVQQQDHASTPTLLDDLLLGIGDCGHNTGVMADLWAKLLRQLRIELCETTNKSQYGTMNELPWLDYWVPSLSNALISSDLTRRKQTAAFCLPRIVSMEIRASAPRIAAAPIFESILDSIEALSGKARAQYYKSVYASQETQADRVMWAELEVIRYAAIEGLLKPTLEGTIQFRAKVATLVPESRLRSMLTHSSMTIRSATFKAIDSIVCSYGGTSTSSFESVCVEADLWKYALPYSIKSDGKEFILSLLQCLLLFLDRLSMSEATSSHAQGHEMQQSSGHVMPIFHDFVVEFLLFDIALKKAGYPGTVALKESFLCQLLECVIVFCSREHPLANDSKLLPKSAAVFRRRRWDKEEQAIDLAKRALLSQEVIKCCVSLLHSTWDSTRNNSYRIVMSLVHLGNLDSIEIPSIFTEASSREGFLRRGVFLSSSPRQREADTGARLLAFLFAALRNEYEKVELIEKLVDLLDRRLNCIKQMLVAILSCDEQVQHEQLPLAHGIIHAIRLIVENDDMVSHCNICPSRAIPDRVDRIISQLFEAVRISLAVVADVKEGAIVDGMDEELVSELAIKRKNSTKMVNPSAIGANGIFSSVTRISDAENAKRLASQRIIVGSWLLTKETCGALAALLSKRQYTISSSSYDEAGKLLISTLTSLKHTGAAFAAHRALQTIAQSCFVASNDRMLHMYPERWVARIFDEITTLDKIRDSTLRRSTGYSLCVLSIMRAEGVVHSQHPLCRSLMMKTISLCLPSKSQSDLFAEKMLLPKDLKNALYSIPGGQDIILNEFSNNVRTRVHALNILRSILLDALLSRDVFPFVGIALITSVIGYMDTEWSVRNSSTMVFAAAMLRSIDSDKNASNKDITGRNPVTAYELFRSYPSLGPFLLALLKSGVQGLFDYHETLSLPPILPILLLLSRLNPVAKSGHDSVVQAQPFIPQLLQLLRHKELIVRKNASNALRNLSSIDKESASSLYGILSHCQESLFATINNGAKGDQWNHVHGILLTMREFVTFFPEARAWLISNGTMEYVAAMSRLRNGSPIIPPSCLSASIEIFSILIRSHDTNRLYDVCKGIVEWLTNNEQRNLDCIGSSELAAQVAKIMVDIDCTIIWDNVVPFQNKEVCLHQLLLLLQSDCIDVRVAATKTFKKSMSYNLTRLVISDDSQNTIESLAFMILSALERELSRDAHDISPHFPTLRRLSRCLVAILFQPSVSSDIEYVQNLRLKSTCLAWRVLDSTAGDCDPDLYTLLHGNVAEMICATCKSMRRSNEQRLLLLTNGFSNPICHWRVRLSAASTLQRLVHDSGAAMVMFSKFQFLQAWIALAQDEDCDVRNAALSIGHDLHVSTPCYDVDELAFMHTMQRLVIYASTQEMINSLLCVLFRLCEKAFHEMDATLDELFESDHVDPFATIFNVGVSRLIFESDAPNSYHETCFVCQLVAVSSIQIHGKLRSTLEAGPMPAAANEFLKLTRKMLSRILEPMLANSSLYDVTHISSTFPLFHNQIIGTLALICVFGRENLMIQEIQVIASKIVNATTDTNISWKIHPLISMALLALAMDCTQVKETVIKSLYHCCFLLPN